MFAIKSLFKKPYSKGIIIGLIYITLTSCSTGRLVQESELVLDNQHQLFWSRVKFRLAWPEGEELDFSYHLLIADQILRPVNSEFEDQLKLWRFHRRAARDGAGHQFSFIYYSSEPIAMQIEGIINNDNLVKELQSLGVLESLIFVNGSTSKPKLKTIEATSDPQWPIEIQKSWPSFIQGVSQTWLDFIEQERLLLLEPETKPEVVEIGEMIDLYREINKSVLDKWGRYGRHAYFHHLNGVFGYTPVYLYDTEEWRSF